MYPPQENYPPNNAVQSRCQGYLRQPNPKPELQALSTAHPGYGAVHVPYIPPSYGWWDDISRNNPQSISLTAAIFILASGGMSLAWSMGFAHLNETPQLSEAAFTHLQICWFFAVIIGAGIVTLFIEKIPKRVFNSLAATLVIVKGILLVSAQESVTAAVIARYCDGFAFGMTLIPTIIAGSEQSVKRFRGYFLSIEQFAIIAGMNIYFVISSNFLIHGILALICGILALILNFVYTIESPIFYLRKGNETEAINVLRKLQTPNIVTTETYALLNEHKQLLDEDIARGLSLNLSNGLIPMVKLCVLRVLVSMSLSLPLVWGFILASALSHRDDNIWKLYMLSSMRLVGIIVGKNTLDALGRKGVSIASLVIGGGLLIAVGALFSSYWVLSYTIKIKLAKILLLVYQLFAGMVAPASTCYLGEAFSVSVKQYFILIVVLFENSIQIIIFCAFSESMESLSSFGYALGGLQIVFAVFCVFGMPETKQTTLREALAKFTNTAKW